MRRAAPLVCLLLVACGGLPTDRRISYATVQALNPGVDGRWVLEEYPEARGVTRDARGKIRALEYGVDDPQGHRQDLLLSFDENEVLTSKQYSGRVVRPLDADPEAGKGITGKPRTR